jgi:hypothetical protein
VVAAVRSMDTVLRRWALVTICGTDSGGISRLWWLCAGVDIILNLVLKIAVIINTYLVNIYKFVKKICHFKFESFKIIT